MSLGFEVNPSYKWVSGRPGDKILLFTIKSTGGKNFSLDNIYPPEVTASPLSGTLSKDQTISIYLQIANNINFGGTMGKSVIASPYIRNIDNGQKQKLDVNVTILRY